MPGLHGFFCKTPDGFFKKKKKDLLQAITWHKNDPSISIDHDRPSASLVVNRGTGAPIRHVLIEPGIEALMYGELYPVDGTNQEKMLKELIHKYFKTGSSAFNETDGVFLILIKEKNPFRLHIINDMFGAFPLNYYNDNRSFVFSSQINPILAIIPHPGISDLGLAEFFTMGFPLNGRTVVDKIKKLWPGSQLIITENSVEEKSYFDPVYTPLSWKKNDLQKEIINTFENAFTIRSDNQSDPVIALSGGLDTRALWAIALNKGKKYIAYSHGSDDSTDLKIARSISNHFQIPSIEFIIDSSVTEHFDRYFNTLVDFAEGNMYPEVFFLIPAYKLLAKKGSFMLDGAGGQLYRRQLKRRYSGRIHGKKPLADFLYHQSIHTDFGRQFFASEFMTANLPEIHEEISVYLNKYDHIGSNEDLLDTFHMHQSAGLKFSTDLLVQSYYINVRQPFYDRRLFELNRSIAPAIRKKHIVHRTIIRHFYPQLKKFPLETRGMSIPYHGFRTRRMIPIGIDYLMNKAGISLDILTRKKPIIDANVLVKEDLHSVLRDLLNKSNFENDSIYNHEFLKNIRHKPISLPTTDLLQLLNTLQMFKKLKLM